MTTHGTVRYWELVVQDNGKITKTPHHNWDFGQDAFYQAIEKGPQSVELFAVSGRASSERRIVTHVWEKEERK